MVLSAIASRSAVEDVLVVVLLDADIKELLNVEEVQIRTFGQTQVRYTHGEATAVISERLA